MTVPMLGTSHNLHNNLDCLEMYDFSCILGHVAPEVDYKYCWKR